MDGKGHIEGWTADEVVEFLATLDLDQYSNDFQDNGITGDILVHLDHEALRDIGVDSVGHRLNILRAVYNIKITDSVPIEAEHYVPATVDFESTVRATTSEISKDLTAITEAIQVRDERLLAAETEIRRLTELVSRMKDQLTPVLKIVKELQPLPTPDGIITTGTTATSITPSTLAPPAQTVSRKFSTKKLFLGSALKQTSPTHIPNSYLYSSEPESPKSPVKGLDITNIPSSSTASSSRTATPNHLSSTTQHLPYSANTADFSLATSRPGPPPRPPPPGSVPSISNGSSGIVNKRDSALPATPIEASANSQSNTSSSSNTVDAFKSFRVGLDDSCSKVLPIACKKYNIKSDWREYSLFICYADQERCLAMDEKPLLIFQELQRANKNPVFMLRKIESSSASVNGLAAGQRHDQEMRF